jgi:hypothetical protein
VNKNVTLSDAGEKNRHFPATFLIAPEETRQSLKVGDFAKLCFESKGHGERMWVVITNVLAPGKYEGTLDNDPVSVPLKYGDKVKFEARHIYTPATKAEMEAFSARILAKQSKAAA